MQYLINSRHIRLFVCAWMLALCSTPPACGGDPFAWLARVAKWPAKRPVPPETAHDPVIEQLARNIDWLEREIDRWGTVSAKSPDIWGEARLTKYRSEVEEVLRREVDGFDKGRINAAQVISDNAMIAASLALRGAGVSGSGPSASVTEVNTSVVKADGETVNSHLKHDFNPTGVFGVTGNQNKLIFGAKDGLQIEQVEELDQLNRYLHHLSELRRINEGDDTADSPGYALNLVRMPVSILPGTKSKRGYGAEITATVQPFLGPELLPIAFRDFVINDLVDQLSLPLTRFINSDPNEAALLLSQFEQREKAIKKLAEINETLASLGCLKLGDFFGPVDDILRFSELEYQFVSADAELNRVCLSDTVPANQDAVNVFTNEVILLSDALHAAFSRHDILVDFFAQVGSTVSQDPDQADETNLAPHESTQGTYDQSFDSGLDTDANNQPKSRKPGPQVVEALKAFGISPNELDFSSSANGPSQSRSTERSEQDPSAMDLESANQELAELNESYREEKNEDELEQLKGRLEQSREQSKIALERVDSIRSILPQIEDLSLALQGIDIPVISPAIHLPGSTRRAALPFPPTQLLQIYGAENLARVTLSAWNAFQQDIINRDVVHVSDVQAFLREELGAAYELTQTDAMVPTWAREADGNRMLHQAIRSGDQLFIDQYREAFLASLGTEASITPAGALAWAVFVESILLNERLLQDIRETAGTQPNFHAVPVWTAFFGPHPCDEARLIFAEYVKYRWPVRVFALDPVVTEQNVADVSSVYRQMQIAVAMSFAAGEIGLSAAMQAMRRLQRDTATVDLNRVAVGFAHGNDTFGWRFYPRFQTPPVESNLTVLFRDLIVGGPTDRQLLHTKEIEPGMRECMALVLMPSFVPHLTVETRGNWFCLDKPSHTQVSVASTVEYSRAIRSIEMQAEQCVQHAHLYRDGEVQRMLARVHQLDRALPLQTLQVPVPMENTLGGFEILSSGQRELAPELLGWYGAPGYDPERNVSLFLSGDNFSVHETQLIVGNTQIPFKLLSRQTMEVTLPAGLPVLRDRKLIESQREFYDGYVDAHIATPYGVSGHLLIPVVRQSLAQAIRVPHLIENRIILVSEYQNATTSTLNFLGSSDHTFSLVALNVPSGVGLESKPDLDLTVVATSGADRLGSFDVKATRTADGFGYAATGTQTKTGLANFKPHLDAYVAYLRARDKTVAPFTIELSAAITANGVQVPCSGRIVVEVRVTEP